MGNKIVVSDPLSYWLGGNIKGGDPDTYCPDVWDFLIEKIQPKLILDVGCGEGYLMKYFHDKGIEAWGIDGLLENKINAPKSIKNNIMIHDYTKGPYREEFYDLILSCEFVEHIEQDYVIYFLSQFSKCNFLAFTHAIPNQQGYHHVNCKDDKYWINLMKIFGFSLSPLTDHARIIAGDTFWNTILIFKNRFNS